MRLRAGVSVAIALIGGMMGCAGPGTPERTLAAEPPRAERQEPVEPIARVTVDDELDEASFGVRIGYGGGIGGVWAGVTIVDGVMKVWNGRERTLDEAEIDLLRELAAVVDWERALRPRKEVSVVSDSMLFTVEVRFAGEQRRWFVGERIEDPALRALRDEVLRLSGCVDHGALR
jgi:hypothetical protein